uniref:Uncharacterized protein n=1 Tax=Davidia involucrata TaxID=16924 RepID=A0A5B7BCL6_DAVIN
MGCFLACFSASKRPKSQKPPNKFTSGDQRHDEEALQPTKKPIKQENIDKPITESKDKPEELLNSNIRKRVTFDLNVKIYEEELSTQEIADLLVGSEKEKERGNKEETQNESQTLFLLDSSMVSYPPNHRYHNCTNECEDIDLEESDSDGDALVEEESSESLFSLSIESGTEIGEKEVNSAAIRSICGCLSVEFREDGTKQGFAAEMEVNSPIIAIHHSSGFVGPPGGNQNAARDRSHSVLKLNPVENLTQWKAPLKHHQEKENINLEQQSNIPFSEEPRSIHNSKHQSKLLKPQDQEIAVDTSLSSWLVESIGNSSSERVNSSSTSFEDRPILGALTVDGAKYPL